MGLDRYMAPIEGDGLRVLVVYDQSHETRGSYGYDTEEETKAAEDEEMRKLHSGEWVVLGFVLERKCSECATWITEDSLWGVVIENSEAKIREHLKDHGFLTAEGKVSDAKS
jgi:hypothetical protein